MGLTLKWLRTYVPMTSFEIHAAEDSKFNTFYSKNVILNEGNHAWMTAENQPYKNLIFL